MKNLYGNVAMDFNKYRSGYPSKFYKKLKEHYNIPLKNQRVLDIATSNGLAARDLAYQDCVVTGLDNSVELINEAKEINQVEKLNIEYLVGDVSGLPFDDMSFNLVTAVHCWKVLPTYEACSEAFRVLKKDGKLIIAQFDQIPVNENIVSKTERLVSDFNFEWKKQNRTGIYPEWVKEIYEVGFSKVETFSFDIDITFTHEQWRGRMRTDAAIGGSLSPEEVHLFDLELESLLKTNYSSDVLKVPHRMFSIVCDKAN
ncbi:class I SAM-dependent methyltransferase [Salinibacillus xinjiangensis]|uniref:Methyltransferase domain-containing protein n=1 Tax=Salinibacillus xinjiangensis TaxID=1229268 RepID=A0A6G1X538_9BACI|nr:class I SAM-dependent methyltransferase [Salinibacillus xinjiangensis]MRG86039.1 methyltransferase domain-containing protein [Salinibacillus xinjiangensis]